MEPYKLWGKFYSVFWPSDPTLGSFSVNYSSSFVNKIFWLCVSMQVDAYIGDPETTTTNRLIAQSYKDGLASGSFIQPVSFPHFFANKKDLVFYSNRPLDEEDRRKEKSEPHTKL